MAFSNSNTYYRINYNNDGKIVRVKTTKEARTLGISFLLSLLLIVISSNIAAFFSESLMVVVVAVNNLMVIGLYYIAVTNFTRKDYFTRIIGKLQ